MTDNYYLINVAAGFISSTIFSIVIFFISLIFQRNKFSVREIMIITLTPLPLSIIVSPITVNLMMFLALAISELFITQGGM